MSAGASAAANGPAGVRVAPCDALFFGAHPDDVEIAAAGTILRLVDAGLRAAIVDATRGEAGSRGSAAERAAEARAAAAALRLVDRQCLGLPDTGVRDDDDATARLVAALRTARPRWWFAPAERDVHPDHVACAQLATRAHFLAGLRNFAPELGAPHRPRVLVRYPGNVPLEPTIAVEIDDLVEPKAAVLRCYASQLAPPDKNHLVQKLDVLERAQLRDRFFGARVGCAAAEPFLTDGPLPLRDLAPLMR